MAKKVKDTKKFESLTGMNVHGKKGVDVTTELPPELAEKFYEVVNKKFGGDIDEAVSQAILLLLAEKEGRKRR